MAQLRQWKTGWAAETKVEQENIVPYMLKRLTIYSRLSDFSNAKVPVATMIIIDENGDTDGFTLRPLPRLPKAIMPATKTPRSSSSPSLANGWYIKAATDIFNNAYQLTDDQQFAMDFVLLKNGSPF